MQKLIKTDGKKTIIVSTLAYWYKIQVWDEETGDLVEEHKYHVKVSRQDFYDKLNEVKKNF